MNADEIGEKGESRFREICADAGLICNKSDRDRAGWDFIVEFPLPSSTVGISLDRRKGPLSCHVQVKTVLANTSAIKMRLSSAERLAKEPKPSFICVFQLRADYSFETMRLIHIDGEVLSKVLRKLRLESARGNDKINERFLSLSFGQLGKQLAVDGMALKSEITSAIGDDYSAYIRRKQKLLERLGFEGSGRGFTVNMSAPSLDHVVDTFLGLDDSVEIKMVGSWEERFGIKILEPAIDTGPHRGSIQPIAADQCVIQFRESPLTPPISFSGDIYFPAIPNLSAEHWKCLIRTKSFSLQLSLTKGIKLSCAPQAVQPQDPSGWLAYWKLLKLVLVGGEINIIPNKIYEPMTFTLESLPLPISADECQFEIEQCEQLANLLGVSGTTQPIDLSNDDIWNAGDYVKYLAALQSHKPVAPVKFRDISDAQATSLIGKQLLWLESFKLGSGAIAFAAIVVPEQINGEVVSPSINLKAIRHLTDPAKEFAKFESDMKIQYKSKHAIGHRPVEKDGTLMNQTFFD